MVQVLWAAFLNTALGYTAGGSLSLLQELCKTHHLPLQGRVLGIEILISLHKVLVVVRHLATGRNMHLGNIYRYLKRIRKEITFHIVEKYFFSYFFFLSPCILLEICWVLSSLGGVSAGKRVGFEIKIILPFLLVVQGAAWKTFAGWK